MVRIAVIVLIEIWLSGTALATTYAVTSSTYTTANLPYTTAMSVSGTFDTASPLPANQPQLNIGPKGLGLVTAWSFFDGVNTLTQANSTPSDLTFIIGTDAKGNINYFFIELTSPPPPNAINDLMNNLDLVSAGPDFVIVTNAAICNALSASNQCNAWSANKFAISKASFAFTPNFTVLPPTIVKSFAAGSVLLNGSTSLTFILANTDLATTLTGVAFSDTFPPGMQVATPNGLASTCGGVATAVQGTSSVSLAGATLANASSCTLTVNVVATSIGSLTNTTGSVTATNSAPGGTASATLAVMAPPPPPPLPVPTLQQWALSLLGLLCAISGALIIANWRNRTSA